MAVTLSNLVTWVYTNDDARVGRELVRFAGVLARQGVIRNRELESALTTEALPTQRHIIESDIAVFLVSPMALDDDRWQRALQDALRDDGPKVALVLVRAIDLKQLPANARRIVLPKDGTALAGRRDSDDAMLDVIESLREIATFAPTPPPTLAATGRSAIVDTLSINEIFSLKGTPSVTFVEPPQFLELQLELRTMGTGLILEGPSKTGKSTAVRKAMEILRIAEEKQRRPAKHKAGSRRKVVTKYDPSRQRWWTGQDPLPLAEFQRFLSALVEATEARWLFIDDFHYLEDPAYRRAIAITAKVLADQPRSYAKITLIGINPLGQALLQPMPDLAGRFRIMHLHHDPDWEKSSRVSELIDLGERAAKIRFLRRDEIILQARGSFYIAQFLCNRIAIKAGVHETQAEPKDIHHGPADVFPLIQDELAADYRTPLLHLAAFDSVVPPRGAGLSLLWLLPRSQTGFISIREAELRFPKLRPVFDWFLQSNLSSCFEQYPDLRGLLYFNRATGTLTMEDPRLAFYLRNLDWREFAMASGHGHVEFHPDDGPLWPVEASTHLGVQVNANIAATITSPLRRLLHLSDLHFSTPDQATIAYSQLAADLRQMGVDRLDAIVISGDLVNRATDPEYDVARMFMEHLQSGFGVKAEALVLVPGNHDVSWVNGKAAYNLVKRSQLRATPEPGTYVEHTPEILEVRDEDKYRLRFAPFAELYEKLKGEAYPLVYEDQATLTRLPEAGLCILGLNSAWQLDHEFRDRADIHSGALSKALLQLSPPQPGELRIATFHHPIHSNEESRIRDSGFLQRLAVAGFRVILHGHVHKADATLYRYDRTVGGRQLELVAAGTFGAPVREWVAGYPLQYNLLLIGQTELTVETRRRAEVNGAWMPDPIWLQGPDRDPLPRYKIAL